MTQRRFLFMTGVVALTLLVTACQTGRRSPTIAGPDATETSPAEDLYPQSRWYDSEERSVPDPTLTPLPTGDPAEARSANAGNADVLRVRAVKVADGSWTFHVTVEHQDTGWDDYANGWDVVIPDGVVLKPVPESPFTRLLLHPHENEQPFTRSQSGIQLPDGVTQLRVRAHDLVDGFGGREVLVDLTASEGPDFVVEWAR
jgi:hypothetical protein